MNSNTFFAHDTDEQIIQAKRLQDLQTWISHLSYVTNECDWLAKIASNKIHDRVLRDELLEKIEVNSALLNEFYNYKSSIQSFQECDDLDCDLFYINQHDAYHNKYVKHIDAYRQVKNKVYLKILD
ncbi:hypothetical protein D778_01301 [Xanthomarina gelatinilytica]|uniref:Uncharacterized protein n=1 Tax=Xanthomarina gelatinilytica TaxID=1137281 RepID=M7MFP0_9FLAO|nr:hypothetical protein [Xanthomarina gelatinilytica]EMQ93891.1 hypothetical protein D778_01301 [Xanthomarina gelatinilytica]